MHTVYEAIIHTPWWVYALFVFLMIRGLRALKPSYITAKQLLLLPTLFLLFSINNLLTTSRAISTASALTYWGLSTLLTLLIAYWLTQRQAMRYKRQGHQLKIPGSIAPLLMILLCFSIKYSFSYKLATCPKIIHNMAFNIALLLSSGLLSGISLGRSLAFGLQFFKSNPYDINRN